VQAALTGSEEKAIERRPRRKRLPLSFLLIGIAILGAIVYLVYANTQANAVYYMTIPELKTCSLCTVQAGNVQKGSIVRNDKQDKISFSIVDGNQTLPVTYNGVVPDIFAPGIQVVVEGHYAGPDSGPFQAQTLLAKCPSKFQAATPTP
jgi:cytochrome c-type biogenesis protein CcmE